MPAALGARSLGRIALEPQVPVQLERVDERLRLELADRELVDEHVAKVAATAQIPDGGFGRRDVAPDSLGEIGEIDVLDTHT